MIGNLKKREGADKIAGANEARLGAIPEYLPTQIGITITIPQTLNSRLQRKGKAPHEYGQTASFPSDPDQIRPQTCLDEALSLIEDRMASRGNRGPEVQ